MIVVVEKTFDDLQYVFDTYRRHIPASIIYELNDDVFSLNVFLSPMTKILILKRKIEKNDLKKFYHLFKKELKIDKKKVSIKSFKSLEDLMNEIDVVKKIFEKIEFDGFYDR